MKYIQHVHKFECNVIYSNEESSSSSSSSSKKIIKRNIVCLSMMQIVVIGFKKVKYDEGGFARHREGRTKTKKSRCVR